MSDLETLVADLSSGLDVSKQLVAAMAHRGLPQEQFETVFELIVCGLILVSASNSIIKTLSPTDQYLLPLSLLLRVVSIVGIPQLHFRNGSKQKLKTLATSTQQALLEWVICLIHLFDLAVYSQLKRLLPILFSLLTYEYLRPYIANLIFLSVVNTPNSSRHPFKPWHVQLVVDLFLNFPLDNTLKSLLALFKYVNPAIDFNNYANDKIYDLSTLPPFDARVFSYPSSRFLDRLSDLGVASNSAMARNLKHYASFARFSKRKRVHRPRIASDMVDLDVLQVNSPDADTMSIIDVTTVQSFVENIEKIKFINVNSIFSSAFASSADRFKKYFLVSEALCNKDSIKKLDFYLRLSILDDSLSLNDLKELMVNLHDFLLVNSTLSLSSVLDYAVGNIKSSAHDPGIHEATNKYENTIQSQSLLRFLLATQAKNLDITVPGSHDTYIARLAGELSLAVGLWTTDRYDALNRLLPQFYSIVTEAFDTLTTSTKLQVALVLRAIRQLDISEVQANLNPQVALLPPTLAYMMLFDLNPLVVSEFCGYLSYIKAYKYEDPHHQQIQNSYVMDSLNFLWRDQAFYQDTGSSQAFLLPSQFLLKLSTVGTFSIASLARPKTVGNVFHNPIFSLFAAEVIWDLEDKFEGLTTRHGGPVTEETLLAILQDNETWLDASYDELRTKVLNELDSAGYQGFCDLLFTSLRTLHGRREREKLT